MLSFGFYNSKGGDRKYDAEQFGAMFNGIITDGVFAHYRNALKVTAGDGNRELVVSSGRAWFNGTWTEVDDNGHSIYLTGSAVETTYFVYLAVNKNSRKNSVAWYSSIMNNIPEKGLYFYLLAQVTIPGGVNKITDAMITDTRGSDLCPYVTGIMETVSFEDLVKRVCGENWQDWLGVYEAGITTGVQNAVRASSEALSEVKSLKAYSVESEAVSYTWAKFEAIATGGGGFEWATDSVHTELADPPMPVYLFRDLSYADLGAGFKPSISLGSPYRPDGETTTKPVPASTQAKVWKEYPYFWEGGGEYGTEVLRYDDLQRVIVTSAGVAAEKYRYRISRLVHLPVTYEPGAYVGTVTADNATAYPRDGYKDGYWYMRFASKAEDVSFYYPGLSAKNVRDAIIEVVKTGGTSGGASMSVIEVEELPATGIFGVMYVVKKPGDTDAAEYLWLGRWERVGGSGSGQNVNGLTAAQIAALDGMFKVAAYIKDDVSAEYNAFKAAFGAGDSGGGEEEPDVPDVPVVKTYTISKELVNVTSNNGATSVTEGASYTATLTASDGYTLDGATVTVTMGGVDITSTAYADGVISIASVTGNVEIIASAVQIEEAPAELNTDGLVFNYDFRNVTLEDYNLSGWGAVKRTVDKTGNALLFGVDGKTGDDKGLPDYSFRNNRLVSSERDDVHLGESYTVQALYRINTGRVQPNLFGWSTAVNLAGDFRITPKYLVGTTQTSATMVDYSHKDELYIVATYVVNGTSLTVYHNTDIVLTDDGSNYDGFTKWVDYGVPNTGFNRGYVTAFVGYNRALTHQEIIENIAFFKTMEVSA